jgi:hypothetical protein
VPQSETGPSERSDGGLFTIGFQLLLILSGALVGLNWLTIVLCIVVEWVTPRVE